ncbi:MAG TPA: ABC transporter permease subunit [Steroidobacteraceae bacterium]|jgi:sodium transport system permease protein|nr:ABC transporter permease subunit [Steroidobacteraceae bacterium]
MSAAVTVYLKECRESLRDRRVLLNVLLLGPLLGPLLFTIILRVTIGMELDRAERELPVVVIGAERAPNLIEALRQQGLVVRPPVDDVEGAVRDQSVSLALRIGDSFAEDWVAGRAAQVEIIFDSSRRDNGGQVGRLRGMLSYYARRTSAMRLVARGLSPAVITPLVIADRDQATPQARGALLFAMLPYFLILNCFIGGMWLAIDSTAGERERQSLEPLLTNPVPRSRILLGKLGAAASFSFVSLTLGLAAFAVAARFLPVQRLAMSLDIGPRVVATILPLMIPLVLLIVVTQIVVSAFAKTFREAQTYLGLLQILPIIPSVLLSVMPINPQPWMYAVPLIGQQLTVMQLLRGEVIAAGSLLWCTLTTLAAMILVFIAARRVYESERLAVNA